MAIRALNGLPSLAVGIGSQPSRPALSAGSSQLDPVAGDRVVTSSRLSLEPVFAANTLPAPSAQPVRTSISSRFMTKLKTWMRRQRTWDRAERELKSQLAGRSFQPGNILVVQLDLMREPHEPINRMWGKTYVFRVDANGRLERRGAFDSSSQPASLGRDPRDYPVTRERGPAYIHSGVYQVSRSVEDQLGGTFRFAPDRVPAYRDSDLPGTPRDGSISLQEAAHWQGEHATKILFHSGAWRSVGCQVIHSTQHADFVETIRDGTGDTFTYVLVRDGEPGVTV